MISRLFDRLPDSTDSWHCPWFRLIGALALVTIVAAVATAGLSLATAEAVMAGVLLGLVLGMRRRGVVACSR